MRRFLAISAITVTLAGIGLADLALAQTKPQATPTPDTSQTNTTPSQLYFPPPNGAPSGRISGGTRGIHPLNTTAGPSTTAPGAPAAKPAASASQPGH